MLIEDFCLEQELRYGLRRVTRAEVLSACESLYAAYQRAVAAQSI
ncbi:MAG: hypothetical protein Q7T39_05595 [Polaromonas sp.]|nr:hypothetical protein [Polaromonas sp.]